jgi:hypothetical protein
MRIYHAAAITTIIFWVFVSDTIEVPLMQNAQCSKSASEFNLNQIYLLSIRNPTLPGHGASRDLENF